MLLACRWLPIIALLAACDSGGVALYVELRTDLVPGAEFAVIETRIEDAAIVRESAALRADDFLSGHRVAEITGLSASSSRRVTVRLLDAERREIARRTLLVAHVEDRSVLVLVTRSCREIVCPDGESCFAGRCQPEACGVDRTACTGECGRASECAPSSCAAPSCETGACFYTPVLGACPAGTYCDHAEGCRPEPGVPIDAGVDAGNDAGTDAGTDGGNDAGTDAGPPPPPFVLWSLARTSGATWATRETQGAVPTELVVAAFAPEGTGELVALTATSVHILRVADLRWIERYDRNAVFPELAGVDIWEMAAIAGISPTLVYAASRDGNWQYEWSSATRSATFTLYTAREDLGADWSDPQAPPWWTVHGTFTHPDNADGWVVVDPSSECPGRSTVGRYLAFLSTDGFGPGEMMVSIYDIDCPFRFVEQRPYGTFGPFSLPSAPAPFSIEAVARPGDLFVFTTR